MGSIKEVNIKNRTYYFDRRKIKDFNPDLLKIDKKPNKSIDIYYIEYITMKDFDYVKVNSVNPLCLIIDKIDGYIEAKNWNKYLTLVFTVKFKE